MRYFRVFVSVGHFGLSLLAGCGPSVPVYGPVAAPEIVGHYVMVAPPATDDSAERFFDREISLCGDGSVVRINGYGDKTRDQWQVKQGRLFLQTMRPMRGSCIPTTTGQPHIDSRCTPQLELNEVEVPLRFRHGGVVMSKPAIGWDGGSVREFVYRRELPPTNLCKPVGLR